MSKPGGPLVALALAVLLVAMLPGCINKPQPPQTYPRLAGYVRDDSGTNADAWPDLNGTLTILDNGAFAAADPAIAQFERLTGIHVVVEPGGDGVKAKDTLALTKASGQYDIIYGLDNAILGAAVAQDLLEPYKPALADRIAPGFVFFPNATWYATPVDHGYVALNWDPRSPALSSGFGFFGPGAGSSGRDVIGDLADVSRYADQFVTEDPRLSTPGLAFLLATIASYPESPRASESGYDWKLHGGQADWTDYWTDLFEGRNADRDADGSPEGCVTVVDDWNAAYAQHFTGAGSWVGSSQRNKAIVTSYSESPAYEVYSGMAPERRAKVLTAQDATFHQIQTMAIAKGTKNLHAAQAWIEFTLTDYFQGLAAEYDAVYPVVQDAASAASVQRVYGGLDPAPGSFQDARLAYGTINANLERWLNTWEEVRAAAPAQCRT